MRVTKWIRPPGPATIRAMRGDPKGATAPEHGSAALRRPLQRVEKIALFERRVEERLVPSAVELLLAAAQVLAEGERHESGGGRDTFCGTVMITLELGAASGAVRDPLDALSARRVAALVQADAALGKRLRALAEREAGRVAGGRITRSKGELRARAVGTRVEIDLEVEAPVSDRP